MVIQEIVVANVASMLLLSFLLISLYRARRNRQLSERMFIVVVLVGIAGGFFETLCFLLDGKEGAALRALNLLFNTLEYTCTASISALWVWYVDLSLNRDVRRLRTTLLPYGIVSAALIVLLIANLFGGFLFVVDEHNVYSRQPLAMLYWGYLMLTFLVSIGLYYRFRAVHGEAQFFPIWMFLGPVFVCCFLQIRFYGIALAWLGCGIGLTGVYLNMQSKMSLVDSLTGLYNRSYIEHKLLVARQSPKYVYSGIMLDVDRFKEINDTYGHSVGDAALEKIAKLLVNASDRDSQAFRFAGDEFIVLVRTEAAKASELEAKTLAEETRIRTETQRLNDAGKAAYRIEFSMGHAVFDPKRPDDDFFRAMDEQMYKDKQQKQK